MVESTTLWTPSVSIADEPVIAAATNLDTAMPRFATSAMTSVRVLAVGALIARAPVPFTSSPALDHRIDMLEQGDVAERVAAHGDDVAVAARRDHSDVAAARAPRTRCCVAAWIAWSGVIPHCTILANCLAVVAVRIDAGVGAEDHLHAGA